MNKRGTAFFRQIIMILYLVMAVIVIFTLSLRAKSVISPEQYADAYSKNIALTINSLFYSDYNTTAELFIPSDFKINILEDKVLVGFKETEKEYDFIPDNSYKIEYKREGGTLTLWKAKK